MRIPSAPVVQRGALAARQKVLSLYRKNAFAEFASAQHPTDVIIIGTGIAGLSVAHYLAKAASETTVRLIDACPHAAGGTSRINGALLCPSLSYAWTAFPLLRGKNAVIPQMLQFGLRGGAGTSPISFDPKLLFDRRLLNFGLHWARRKARKTGQSDHIKAIMEYSMQCFNDEDDDVIQSIDYNRFAQGTRTNDGGFAYQDSSGDIGLFCKGIARELARSHGNTVSFSFGETVVRIQAEEGKVNGVETRSKDGEEIIRAANKVVVAAGIGSYDLCRTIGIQCPVFPVKGYIITFHSGRCVDHNIELSGRAFVSPLGNGVYRLSGFAEFTSDYSDQARAMIIDNQRVEALVDVAKEGFPDMELVEIDCGYRPISPDDTPIIGPTSKFPNLFLCTGHGSKGWTMGPGSGKLLSDVILGNSPDIDLSPFNPKRFVLNIFQ